MTTKNEFSNASHAGYAATTPSSFTTGSSAGRKTTARQTDCGGGAGRSGDDMLNPAVIREEAERDRAMFRRHGSRIDGGMVVATLAFAAVVFVIGVIVGVIL